MKKYLTFTGQALAHEDGQFYPLPNRDEVVSEWGLWTRSSVTSRSNHAESFHRVLRAAVKPNEKHVGIANCLTEVVKAIAAAWKDGFTRSLQYYRRRGDLPISWSHLEEVARRFEVEIPKELQEGANVTEDQVIDAITKLGLDRLQRIKITKVGAEKPCSISPWVGDPFPARRKKCQSETVEEIVPEDSGVVAIARDIFAGLSFEIREALEFHWVFHWCATAVEQSNLDLTQNIGETYIVVWH